MTQSGSVITLAEYRLPRRAIPRRAASGSAGSRSSDPRVVDPDVVDPDPPAPFDLTTEYDAHGHALFGFALNALHDRQLAEDCVQETFLRAWRARERYDSDRATVRTWLFAIERNVIIDLQRSQHRLPRTAVPEAVNDAAAESSDTLERLEVAEAIGKLSPEHRAVVVAVHLHGRSYTELAAASGVPIATLRTRAFYALRALREHLDGQETRND